jgi:ABC-type phosphate/phosphonate transport system substrate-binding protein
VPHGGEAVERWTLVTGKDHPASLEGYTVQSSAGYSKRFVRAAAPELARQVEIRAGTAVLSALRRAADGDKVAVLLDGAQGAALAKLPFASQLAVIATSPPMPVAVVATIGKRMDEGRWKALEPAFRGLADDPAAREALDGVRMAGFVPLDQGALAAARTAWRRTQ